jgi:hypothetical protein
MQLFLTFNLSFCNLATVFATFSKIGQFFFKLLVTLVGIKPSSLYCRRVSDEGNAKAVCLVRCLGHSQIVSSLSPLVNKLLGGILSWAQTLIKSFTVVPQSSCLSCSQLVPNSFIGD